jgi:hypothetical protein
MSAQQGTGGSNPLGEAADNLSRSKSDLDDWSEAAEKVLSGEAPADATPPEATR